eukprot:980047-Pyramimonas_sp.AAC.1
MKPGLRAGRKPKQQLASVESRWGYAERQNLHSRRPERNRRQHASQELGVKPTLCHRVLLPVRGQGNSHNNRCWMGWRGYAKHQELTCGRPDKLNKKTCVINCGQRRLE